jgi:glyoxylase-like metal-dependent hydrolase (beta-lactamase superfamily II)
MSVSMSLDKATSPGRPGPDELGPSRYSLRVGEIDVLVVSDGVLTALPAATLAVNAGPAVLAAWLDDMVLPPAFDWPVNVVVVRSSGRTVLIDAGIGVEYKDFRRAGRLLLRLEAAGIDPASLTDVVLTHLHMDHVGGLLGDGVKGQLRPDLRVHVSAAEAEFWAAGADLSRTSMPPGIPDALRSPRGSWTSTAACCGRSRRSTRWRRGWSPVAPAATPPGTASSAWSLAATG